MAGKIKEPKLEVADSVIEKYNNLEFKTKV
jgi:hypothetical protein